MDYYGFCKEGTNISREDGDVITECECTYTVGLPRIQSLYFFEEPYLGGVTRGFDSTKWLKVCLNILDMNLFFRTKQKLMRKFWHVATISDWPPRDEWTNKGHSPLLLRNESITLLQVRTRANPPLLWSVVVKQSLSTNLRVSKSVQMRMTTRL